jgi:hypothetical protein
LGLPVAGFTIKWIMSWATLKLPSSATCTWSYHRGYKFSEGDLKYYLLQLMKNIYGQKQTGHISNEYLMDMLSLIGFKASLIDAVSFMEMPSSLWFMSTTASS